MANEACCTCATLFSTRSPQYDEKTEKPISLPDHRLDCCGRITCGDCIDKNPRFATYCPFCQISSTPTSLPQGLRDPPSYTSRLPNIVSATATAAASPPSSTPPAYSALDPQSPFCSTSEKPHPTSPDVLHFLDPSSDTIPSLSLRYGVPAPVLRRTNNLFSDGLLAARPTILIPGTHYKGGVSLSPRPVGGEEQERRARAVTRWMVACKVADHDQALVYLRQAQFCVADAVEAFKADERWEREHPLLAKGKGKDSQKRRRWGVGSGGGGLVGQLS